MYSLSKLSSLDLAIEDFTKVTQHLEKNNTIKNLKVLQENQNDESFIERLQYFRNMQVRDKNFDKKKEKILWPIFEFKNQNGDEF